jgi:hypothetical protein
VRPVEQDVHHAEAGPLPPQQILSLPPPPPRGREASGAGEGRVHACRQGRAGAGGRAGSEADGGGLFSRYRALVPDSPHVNRGSSVPGQQCRVSGGDRQKIQVLAQMGREWRRRDRGTGIGADHHSATAAGTSGWELSWQESVRVPGSANPYPGRSTSMAAFESLKKLICCVLPGVWK